MTITFHCRTSVCRNVVSNKQEPREGHDWVGGFVSTELATLMIHEHIYIHTYIYLYRDVCFAVLLICCSQKYKESPSYSPREGWV